MRTLLNARDLMMTIQTFLESQLNHFLIVIAHIYSQSFEIQAISSDWTWSHQYLKLLLEIFKHDSCCKVLVKNYLCYFQTHLNYFRLRCISAFPRWILILSVSNHYQITQLSMGAVCRRVYWYWTLYGPLSDKIHYEGSYQRTQWLCFHRLLRKRSRILSQLQAESFSAKIQCKYF